MKNYLKTGLNFGSTSGIITTLGLMVGLNFGTHFKPAVIGGILTIAVADAFSDALGIHMAEESENCHTTQEIWLSTLATFISKFVFALSFALPVWWLELDLAVLVNVVWGLFLLTLLSLKVAKDTKANPVRVVIEHLFITILVITLTGLLGRWLAVRF